MCPRRLHVLVVDPAIGVDVVAEVGVIGDFAQVSLEIANKALTGVASVHLTSAKRAGTERWRGPYGSNLRAPFITCSVVVIESKRWFHNVKFMKYDLK